MRPLVVAKLRPMFWATSAAKGVAPTAVLLNPVVGLLPRRVVRLPVCPHDRVALARTSPHGGNGGSQCLSVHIGWTHFPTTSARTWRIWSRAFQKPSAIWCLLVSHSAYRP